ncbi:MAG: type II toxin-antitoxin system VapC family toxin [Thermoleophilia bacterium]
MDASVFGALAFNESRAAEAADMLGGITAAAPGLVRYEMANIARTKSLRNPDRAALIAQAFRRWLDLPVKLVSPEFDGVLALALARRLSAYDAAYLYLAGALDAPLLTFDERLASAWRDSA